MMQNHLLSTKLYLPQPRPGYVSRPRLSALLTQGLTGKLTLVSAPAGFGKTTLLSAWARDCGRQVAWLSLNEEDNEPAGFLRYMIAAIETVQPGFGESARLGLTSLPKIDRRTALTGLINEIAEIQQPFVLALDDYHLITNPEIHEMLRFVVENQSPSMHLVVASRSDPPWPLGRLRAQQEIIEIRAGDLRFTLEEAETLINERLRIGLSSEDLARLETKTEGWIAGLLMAAMTIQGQEKPSAFIRAFAGSSRFIFDYLVEEVLNQLSPDSQDFLLKTSILDRFCAPLCDAILQRADSQAKLTSFEKRNVYLIPLDDRRNWYRYHRLFADLLKSRLIELHPQDVKGLHQAASAWFEDHDLFFDAVRHAFAASDIPRVARLAENNMLALMERGELESLIWWIDRLPTQIDAYPWLRVAQAWALTQAGAFDKAKNAVSTVEDWLHSDQLSPDDDYAHLRGHILAIRCYLEILSLQDYDRAARHAHGALADLPASDVRTRAMVMVFLGTIQRIQGDFPGAIETLDHALSFDHMARQPYVKIDILSQIARIHREQGRLLDTERVCRAALSVADRYAKGKQHRLPVAAYTMGVLGRICYEWNRLDEAIDLGYQSLALAERWGQANTLLGVYLFLARVLRAQGRFQEALEAARAAKQIGAQISRTHEFYTGTCEIEIMSAMGDLTAVQIWIDRSAKFEIDPVERWLELAPLLLDLYREKRIHSLDELNNVNEQALANFERQGNQRRSLKCIILKARINQALGDPHQALAMLQAALAKGEPEGFTRSFLDHGPPMQALLQTALAAGVHTAYANRLLTTFQSEAQTGGLQTGKMYAPVESLTARELEVLRLLSSDLSIPAIADSLFISTGTLRTHVKRIYRKLQVHSRFEAVTKGRDLGFI